jgi:hypothetical protein
MAFEESGAIPVNPPVRFVWPHRGYPPHIDFRGVTFVRSTGMPEENVAAHYRENVRENSAHLKVYATGAAVIDHVDHENPEVGPVNFLRHLWRDTTVPQKILIGAVTVAAAVLLWAAVGTVRRLLK